MLIGACMPRDQRVWDALLAWMAETGADEPLRGRRFREPGRTPEERQQIIDIIQAFVASQTAEEVYCRGQECHLPWGFVRRPEENLDDPHWHDRGFFGDRRFEKPRVPRRLRTGIWLHLHLDFPFPPRHDRAASAGRTTQDSP